MFENTIIFLFSALYVSLPVTLLLVSLVCMAGLVIYGTFHDCDPYLDGKLLARDQVCQLPCSLKEYDQYVFVLHMHMLTAFIKIF